jgi:hypothetical protein
LSQAYRVQERGGVIFAYMGPGEPPLFPSYQFLNAPADRSFAIKLYSDATISRETKAISISRIYLFCTTTATR